MEGNLLYGQPVRRHSGRRWAEEPGRFLLDFEAGVGRGDGEIVTFTASEMKLLRELVDRRETFIPDSEIAEIFGIEVSGARDVAEMLSKKLRRISGPWPSPIKVYVDGYGWDAEALFTARGR